MAWTTPMTFVASTPLTAAQLNTYLRDNLLETEPAKATSQYGIFVAAGLNSIVERVGASAIVDAAQTTNSASYTDLETVGPTVTCITGTRALIFLEAEITLGVVNISGNMTVAISGATTLGAADAGSLQIDGVTLDKSNRIGISNYFDDLVPGENTFTCKYKCFSGNNATFADRKLTVIPF